MLLIQLQSVQERLRLFNNPTTAIEVPEEETLKTTTSPVQTATGKDLTNPLRADALLKSINKDNTGLSSSLSLNSKLVYPSPSTFGKSKMTNLATNPLMQEPVFKPDYLKAAKKEEERYYVVFKGPRSGIYTTWGETQKICQEDKSTNKKFRTLEQAQMELRLYGEAKKATPLLRPKINPLINKRREAARDQRFPKEEPIGLEPIIYFQEFVQIWNKARSACQQDFINERFYTTDKPTKSLYNFIEGSDPQLIYQAFRAGLIDNIYPSNNLLEIKEFHSSIFEAIKRFRKNVLKAQDKKIYIKVTSFIPDWNHEENYSPYHLCNRRAKSFKFKRISEIILQAITEENMKVNYADSHCIVISYRNKAEKQDIQLLTQYGIPFLTNTIDAASTTKEAFFLMQPSTSTKKADGRGEKRQKHLKDRLAFIPSNTVVRHSYKKALLDNRIESRKDCILGIARGNLAYSRFMFTVYPQYGISLDTKDLDQTLAFVHEFERSDLMKPGNKVFSITYLVAYALTSSHHSIDYREKEYIEIDDLFNEIGSVEADALLKSINKDNTGLSSSLSLNSKLVYPSPSTFGKSKMTNLATNPLMQEPVFKPDYLKAAKQEEERYYVVFKGPRSGIYTTWGETQKICQEDKSTNKKFRTLEQAQMELRLYGEAKKATPLLRPKINPLINKRREAARDQRFPKEEPIGLEPIIYFQEFVQIWNKARSACQQDFINERFYTTDKPTKSLYNFIEGSDPQLIYQAFRAGLIDNIYPSNNLLEIKEFHSSIFEAIKRFRKNVLKAQDKKIYIKVTSSIPDWNHEENYSPYHCMEIGLAKSNENLHFSKAMEDKNENPIIGSSRAKEFKVLRESQK
ncbi:hypothetical protein Tco_0556571 [Tanacetum coccineum]